MIFPNRAPDPELRPGMGYAGGSHSLLGYQSGADALGYTAEMGYHAGAAIGYHAGAALGDFSASMENAAVDAGIAPNDIDLLNSVGATDSDLSDLINGTITLSALYAKYGVTLPPSGITTGVPGSAAATGSPVTVSAPALQSPPGSTLLFVCNWTAGIGNLSVSTNAAIASLTTQLAAHGMSVVSSSVTSAGPVHYGIQVTILDNVGHDTIANALSVPTAIMQGIVGNNFTNTPTLSLITSGGPGGNPNPPSSDALAWLENNALYIGLAVGGLVLLNNFTGKRR